MQIFGIVKKMNRILKFKIWDYKNQQMITSTNYNTQIEKTWKDENYAKVYRVQSCNISNFFTSISEMLEGTNQFKFLQYVGKDFNEKEVYEYDIIKDFGGLVGVVFYDFESKSFKIKYENGCDLNFNKNIILEESIFYNKNILNKFRWLGLKG